MNHASADDYAMGRSKTEEERLQLQSALLEPSTRRLFELTGIGPGDTALVVARLVGPFGRIIEVDLNPAIVEAARRRVRRSALRTCALSQEMSGRRPSTTTSMPRWAG